VARVVPLLLLFALSGCSGGRPQPADAPRPRAPAAPGKNEDDRAIAALSAVPLIKVPADTFGPYVGDRRGAAVAVWAALENEQKRAWFSAALSETGKPLGKPLRLGDAPRELGLVAVRPEGPPDARESGFVVLSTHKTTGDTLEALLIGPRGELRAPMSTLIEQSSPIQWIEAVGTSQGTLIFWASRRGEQTEADMYGLMLDRNGKKLAPSVVLLSGARAWQATRTRDGAALAAVVPPKVGAPRGSVQLLLLGAEGRPLGKTLVVSAEPSAEADLDVASVGERLVLAWSDRRNPEPRLYIAAVDTSGAIVKKPTPAVEPFGEQALVRLVPPFGSGNAYLVWENLLEPPPAGRSLEIAPVKGDGTVGAERATLSLLAEDGTIPELRAGASGLAGLTLAAACPKGQTCQDPERLPTYIGLAPTLDVIASEPLRLNALEGRAATLGWGLTCASSNCFVLAALPTTPAPVFTVELAPRSNHWQPAAQRVRPGPAPRARFVDAVAQSDPLSSVVAARVGETTLVGWLTYFDPATPWERLKKPAPDGRFEPLQAELVLRAVGTENEPLAAVQTLSQRARSPGGVAIAAGEPARREALVVWSAIDQGFPQVFLTMVDATGKRIGQRMLTRRKGEIADVAAAFTGDGFVVAWIDERDGDPEVYAAKVNRLLQRVGPEQRVTKIRGAASGLALLAKSDHVLAAWADSRNSETQGWADIYTARLRPADAAPLSAEERVAATPVHSHSPVLAALGTETILAWVDAPPEGSLPSEGSGVRVVALDAQGHAAGAPALVATAGAPSGVAFDCAAGRCRAVVSSDVGGNTELAAFEWKAGAAPRPARLLSLSGPASQAGSPVLLGNELFFADQVDHKARVRRMGIAWE